MVANETVSLILSDALCERCLEIVREAAGNNSSTNNVANSRVLYRGCVKILATILEARPEMSIFLLKNGVAQILAEHLERCKIIRANVGTSEYSPVQSMDDLHDAMHLLGLLLPSQTRSSGGEQEKPRLHRRCRVAAAFCETRKLLARCNFRRISRTDALPRRGVAVKRDHQT